MKQQFARSRTRRATMLLLAMVVGVVTSVVAAPTTASSASPSYRYWSYWSGAGQLWTYSTVGPASRQPRDGDVEGWRFAVNSGTNGLTPPSVAPQFGQICAGVEMPSPGRKRIAVVLDPGASDHAPAGEVPGALQSYCAVVPDLHTGAQVLSSLAAVRVERGLICGLNGYPATECAAIVVDSPTTVSLPIVGAPALHPAVKPKRKITKKRCISAKGKWNKKTKKCKKKGKILRLTPA